MATLIPGMLLALQQILHLTSAIFISKVCFFPFLSMFVAILITEFSQAYFELMFDGGIGEK